MKDLERARAVARMQKHIEANLEEEITLASLARAAGYSPWHSARMFREYTGLAPFEYVRRLRLSRAALRLRDEKRRVVDVAMDFVFDSHEGFTRAFRKEFGIPPKSYSASAPPIPLFTPYPADGVLAMGRDRQGLAPLADGFRVEIMSFPRRKLILKRAAKAGDYFGYVAEAGCDVWGVLVSIKEALYEPVGLWLPAALRPAGTSAYAQGVEVPEGYAGAVPDGFDCIGLEACEMLMFQGEPYDDERFDEAILGLSAAIERYDPSKDGYRWSDAAPRVQLEPQGYRGYMEARPVERIVTPGRA